MIPKLCHFEVKIKVFGKKKFKIYVHNKCYLIQMPL